ncbi:MAG: hypothetical protein R6X12_03145 [bacterium]
MSPNARQVARRVMTGGRGEFDVSALAAGVYHVVVRGARTSRARLVVGR